MRNGMMRYYCYAYYYCIATADAEATIFATASLFLCAAKLFIALYSSREEAELCVAAFETPLLSPENSGLRRRIREGDTLSCIFHRTFCIGHQKPRNVVEKLQVYEEECRFKIR